MRDEMSDEEAFRIVLELASQCPLEDEMATQESERREEAISIVRNALKYGLGYDV